MTQTNPTPLPLVNQANKPSSLYGLQINKHQGSKRELLETKIIQEDQNIIESRGVATSKVNL